VPKFRTSTPYVGPSLDPHVEPEEDDDELDVVDDGAVIRDPL
jgi:hypothetical protein